MPISQGRKPRFREVEQLTQGHTVILGIVTGAADPFARGVQRLCRGGEGPSSVSICHLLTTPDPRDVGICGQRGGLPSTRFPLLEKCVFVGGWGGAGGGERDLLVSGSRERAVQGSSLGAGPSQVTSPPPPPPVPWLRAFPQCPGCGVGSGAGPSAPRRGRGCRPCSRPGPPPSPPSSASSSPGRRAAGSPRVHLARVPAPHPPPPRCSGLANRAWRCRWLSPPTDRLALTLSPWARMALLPGPLRFSGLRGDLGHSEGRGHSSHGAARNEAVDLCLPPGTEGSLPLCSTYILIGIQT